MSKYIQAVRTAAHAATMAHRNQTRKNESTPYIVHPATVAQMVSLYGGFNYVLAVISAWYHDVLEDCGSEGEKIFYESIAHSGLDAFEQREVELAVKALTKDDTKPNRAIKLVDTMDRLFDPTTPSFAVLVKICDRIDNLSDMDGFKPGFRQLYLEETDYMISRFKSEEMSVDGFDLATTTALDDLIRLRNRL